MPLLGKNNWLKVWISVAVAYSGSVGIYTFFKPIDAWDFMWPPHHIVLKELSNDRKELIWPNTEAPNGTNFLGFKLTSDDFPKLEAFTIYLKNDPEIDSDRILSVYCKAAEGVVNNMKARAYVIRFLLVILPLATLYLVLRSKFHQST